jgi:hypothetical protein
MATGNAALGGGGCVGVKGKPLGRGPSTVSGVGVVRPTFLAVSKWSPHGLKCCCVDTAGRDTCLKLPFGVSKKLFCLVVRPASYC